MKFLILISLLLFNTLMEAQSNEELYTKAISAFDNSNFKTALHLINKVLDEDPSNPDYYEIKAQTLLELKQYQEAYDTYNNAIIRFPKMSFLFNSRANLLLGLREVDLAIKDYTSALKLAESDETFISYLSNRAGAKMHKRDYYGAYDDLIKAYAFDSTNLATLTNLGVACDEIDKGDETLKYLIKVVEIDSLYFPAYINIGFKYQILDQHENAILYFNKALKIQPNEALGYSNRSFSFYKLGKLKLALKDIEKSIKIYPGNSYAYKVRALIFIKDNKPNKACQDLEIAITQGFTEMYGNEVIELQKEHCLK